MFEPGLVAEHGQDAASLNHHRENDNGVYREGAASGQGGGGFVVLRCTQREWKLYGREMGSVLFSDLTPYPDFPKTMISYVLEIKQGRMITR